MFEFHTVVFNTTITYINWLTIKRSSEIFQSLLASKIIFLKASSDMFSFIVMTLGPLEHSNTIPSYNEISYCVLMGFNITSSGSGWCNMVVRKVQKTLFVAIAQDDNNKILPIVFVIVESETTKACFFFLKNLKTYHATR